jgi:segregation and condensation protein A
MTHTVSVGEFEGPLGLLLELVERNKLEVTAISVAKITSDYLERVKQLGDQSPESLSEFLQLGARLLYVKSLALLPGETAEERTMELARLTAELEDYRRFQHAARALARHAATRTWERPITEHLATADLPLPELSLSQLSEAFTAALRRTTPAPPVGIIPQHISLDATMAKLHRQLAAGFELRTLLATCDNRLEIIVTFLALLELIRSGAARVGQAGQFDPIVVEAAHA